MAAGVNRNNQRMWRKVGWYRLVVVLCLILGIVYLLFSIFTHSTCSSSSRSRINHQSSTTTPTISLQYHHLVFGIASSSASYPNRRGYLRSWWKPKMKMRGYIFLDRKLSQQEGEDHDLPPLLISQPTSHFPYTFPRGLPSAIRVARIVKETVDLNLSHVRWFVFGDDDTVFFPHNLLRMLSNYDFNLPFYIGTNSDSFQQNSHYSFHMAFGGAGFALSYPLAHLLAKVLDSCLLRYSHLYGSDSRIFACLAELGVPLTHHSGFHQVDIRGDLFGFLSAHPLVPLLSLHHLDSVEPIFPGMNRSQALEQLFSAVEVDPERILQQTVCYDHSQSLTISISWGYSVQVFEGNQLLLDLLPLPRTFMPWRRSGNIYSNSFMFNTRDVPKDLCKRPAVFFLENVFLNSKEIQSNYKRHFVRNCLQNGSAKNIKNIRVLTQKLALDAGQLSAPRRQCCDVLTSFDTNMEISIRQCGDEELISMRP